MTVNSFGWHCTFPFKKSLFYRFVNPLGSVVRQRSYQWVKNLLCSHLISTENINDFQMLPEKCPAVSGGKSRSFAKGISCGASYMECY